MFDVKVTAFCVALAFMACSHGSHDKRELQTQSRPQQVLSKSVAFETISLSGGGGFTGMHEGFTIFPDGRVEGWSKSVGGKRTVFGKGKISAGRASALAAELRASGALSQTCLKTGNYTMIVHFAAADSTYKWSWSRSEDAPGGLAAWYKSTYEMCRKIFTTN